MHRQILEACAPGFAALLLAVIALIVLGKLSRLQADWSRLGSLHRCQRGGVQSLAFVLTIPIFLTIVLFIIQVSQLMIAQMVIHYAAFAGVRAAAVWIPAAIVDPSDGTEISDSAEVENRLAAMPVILDDGTFQVVCPATEGAEVSSQKLRNIRLAVIQACAAMCPSRNLGLAPQSSDVQVAISAQQRLYAGLDPQSSSNSRIATRISNKLAYADWNTQVLVEWIEARHSGGSDPENGRAYNVKPAPGFDTTCPIRPFSTTFSPSAEMLQMHYRPNEVGWQDPITVRVIHQFALLPGPGRFLARRLVSNPQVPDQVAPLINRDNTGTTNTVTLSAAATMTNEGIKSVLPYVERQ